MASKNRSLQAKTAARMAAVQLAYRAKMRAQHIVAERLAQEYENFRKDEGVIKGEAPNKTLLLKLLNGLAKHEAVLQKIVEEQLKGGWNTARTNPVLLAILQTAAFELDQHRELKTPVIIDEYTTIAAKLLEQEEIAFVHATLKTLADQFRD